MIADNQILVHYRTGPFGPEILIDAMTKEQLSSIRSTFVELAQGKLNFLNFLTCKDVRAVGLDSLVLRSFASDDHPKKCLELKKTSLGGVGFIWSLPRGEWWHCVNLIDGLLECLDSAHQHLNEDREGIDDANIELAFRENAELRSQLCSKTVQ